jgi:hypothetical protein
MLKRQWMTLPLSLFEPWRGRKQKRPGECPAFHSVENAAFYSALLLSFTFSASRYTLSPISLNLAYICAMPCSLLLSVAA